MVLIRVHALSGWLKIIVASQNSMRESHDHMTCLTSVSRQELMTSTCKLLLFHLINPVIFTNKQFLEQKQEIVLILSDHSPQSGILRVRINFIGWLAWNP